MAENKQSVSHLLSEGILKVTFEDLSPRNVQIAKDKLLDNIGNLAGGGASVRFWLPCEEEDYDE